MVTCLPAQCQLSASSVTAQHFPSPNSIEIQGRCRVTIASAWDLSETLNRADPYLWSPGSLFSRNDGHITFQGHHPCRDVGWYFNSTLRCIPRLLAPLLQSNLPLSRPQACCSDLLVCLVLLNRLLHGFKHFPATV
jgi:hypothetical protein